MTDASTAEAVNTARTAAAAHIGRLFSSVARRKPNACAIACGDERLSYGALNERVNRLASVLCGHGLARGDRIALLARNCAQYLEVELAAAKLGLITAALNWRLSERELSHCVQLASPSLLIAQPEYAAGLARVSGTEISMLVLDASYEQAIAHAEPEEPQVELDPEDGLLIIYTSGTTGLPKGALISHRAMAYRALVFSSETAAPRDASFVAWSPLFHMGASDFAHATLLRGGTVFIVDGFQSEALVRLVANERIHYLPVVPGMIAPFIEALEAAAIEPRGIGCIGAMADLVPRRQIARITSLLGAPYLNTFGSTETGIPPATASLIPIGQIPDSLAKEQSSFCEVRLVDEHDQDVADGEPGEVLMRGPTLFSGYWADATASAEAFRDGWFHMGDVCRRTSDGRLEFVDRRKYLIKSGGENIYPAEIEQVVLADPRVIDAAAVRQAHPRWGEVPVLFVASDDPALCAADVLELCREKLASYKLPKAIKFIGADEFPRTSTGKIERQALEQRLMREIER